MAVACAPSAVYAESAWRPYLLINSFTYSQPVSIDAAMNDWHPPFTRGTSAVTYNHVETGVEYGHWHIGVLKKLEYYAKFSRDISEFYYRSTNHLPLDVGRTYDLSLSVTHYYLRGVSGGYRWSFNNHLSLVADLNYYEGLQLTDGSVSGTGSVSASQDYNFNFDLGYYYSHDALFGKDVAQPTGKGFSGSLYLKWKPDSATALSMDLVDLYGNLYWNDTPYTFAHGSTANKTYDKYGYVHYAPTLSGVNRTSPHVQRIPLKVFVRARRAISRQWAVVGEYDHYPVLDVTRVGLGHRFGGADVQLLYGLQTSAITLKTVTRRFSIALMADTLKRKDAHLLGLTLSYNFP